MGSQSAAVPQGGKAPGSVYPGGVWTPPAATYSVSDAEDVELAMDDGVTLRAIVYRPAHQANGPRTEDRFPVILEMTPYTHSPLPSADATYLIERGYIYVVVRPRGTAGSGGEVQQFSSRDGLDGRTAVAWAANDLSGSDGRVGLLGCSYPGATALATAAQVGPDSPVKAVIAACIGLDMQHRQVWTTNGLPNAALSYADRAGAMMGDQASAATYFQRFRDGLMAGGPEAYDGYWQDRLPLEWASRIAGSGIPVLLWAGWQDINEIGAVHAYTALQNAASNRPFYAPMSEDMSVSSQFQLIMGNWGHGEGLDPGVYLQWFETWLKGVDTGIQRTATPMHLFEVGTDRWINVARYPLVQEYTRWNLMPGGSLGTGSPASQHEATLVWGDPDAPEGRVRFETPAFADGATLAGPVSATVYARSSNTNLALLAKLYDVAPDGAVTRITTGGLLGSQRALDANRSWIDRRGTVIWPWPTLDGDEYLQPGHVYRFDVPLASRQWSIRPGHHLRLELTTQSPASVCPQQGTMALVSEPCRLTVPQQGTLPGGRYTILSGPEHPSALNLPQLPYGAFPAVRSGRTPSAPGGSGAALTLPLDWGGE